MGFQLYRTSHSELADQILQTGPVDVVITDPPFSDRVHAGQKHRRHDGARGVAADGLAFDAWSPEQAGAFVRLWSPLVRRWFNVLCSHDQIPTYEAAFREIGRYVFAPIPCVVRGATVRLAGDGPSSWTAWMLPTRPVGMRPLSGTLPGAYTGSREKLHMAGAKPLWLMDQLIADYTRPCDVVCDPCAGSGTTLLAAVRAGRIAIGAEPHPDRHGTAMARLTAANGDTACAGS